MKPTNRVQAQMVTTLVAGATTAPTGALVGASNALGILNGEIGILEGNTLVTAPTGDTVKLVQGTPSSANIKLADPWGVKDPAIVETDYIYKDNLIHVPQDYQDQGLEYKIRLEIYHRCKSIYLSHKLIHQ